MQSAPDSTNNNPTWETENVATPWAAPNPVFFVEAGAQVTAWTLDFLRRFSVTVLPEKTAADGTLFPIVSEQEVSRFIDTVMALPYDGIGNAVWGPNYMMKVARAIAYNEPEAQTPQVEEVKQNRQTIADQIVWLKPIVAMLLSPEFHNHISSQQSVFEQEDGGDNAAERVIFQYMTTSPLWKVQESIELKRQAQAFTRNLRNQLVRALENTQWQPTVAAGQDMLKELQRYVSQHESKFTHIGDKNAQRMLDEFQKVTCAAMTPGEWAEANKYYMTLNIPTNEFYEWIEDTNGKWHGSDLLNAMISMLQTLSKHWWVKVSLDYRVFEPAVKKWQATLPLATKQEAKLPDDIVTPSAQMMWLFKKYGVSFTIPKIAANAYFEQYIAHEKTTERGQNDENYMAMYKQNIFFQRDSVVVASKNGAPNVCVSPDNNFSFLFAALNARQDFYGETRNEKRLCRTIDAQKLIALNTLGGKRFAEGKKDVPNPFYTLLGSTHKLVVLWAEEFLQGKWPGTLLQLVKNKHTADIIFLSSTGNLAKLADEYYESSDKDKKNPIHVPRLLKTNTVEIPVPHPDLVAKSMKDVIMKTLAQFPSLFEAPPTLTYSEAFYTAIQKMAGADYACRRDMLEYVARNCISTSNEKDMLQKVYHEYRWYLKSPISISLDEIHQVVADFVLDVASKHNEEAIITDDYVEYEIIKNIAYIYLQKHKETMPLEPASSQELHDFLKKKIYHQRMVTKSALELYGNQKTLKDDIMTFMHICERVNEQIINKLLLGKIDSTLSPKHKNPF